MAGCGGVRKVRIAAKSRGKSGGARVICFFLRHRDVIYLLCLFTKNDAADLGADGKKSMRRLAHEIKNHPFQP